jgi:hypothetical protein
MFLVDKDLDIHLLKNGAYTIRIKNNVMNKEEKSMSNGK